jgi:ligand-binding sensor domain-containing protein
MKKVCLLYRKIKFFILCVLLSSPVQAQSVEPKFDELIVGIPNCVLQDKNGFIWIGAQEGLLRYDGNELKKYHNIPFDSTSISGDWVFAISEDITGNLWVATMNGLNYFDQGTEQFVLFNVVNKNDSSLTSKSIKGIKLKDSNEKLQVWDLYKDAENFLWIATVNCGLLKLNIETGEVTHFINDPADPTSLPSDWVYSFFDR